jgi:hypothetical protein
MRNRPYKTTIWIKSSMIKMYQHKLHNRVSSKHEQVDRNEQNRVMKRHSENKAIMLSAVPGKYNKTMQRTVRLSECAAVGSVVFFDRAAASDLKRYVYNGYN